jgi:hypothetical protein
MPRLVAVVTRRLFSMTGIVFFTIFEPHFHAPPRRGGDTETLLDDRSHRWSRLATLLDDPTNRGSTPKTRLGDTLHLPGDTETLLDDPSHRRGAPRTLLNDTPHGQASIVWSADAFARR